MLVKMQNAGTWLTIGRKPSLRQDVFLALVLAALIKQLFNGNTVNTNIDRRVYIVCAC